MSETNTVERPVMPWAVANPVESHQIRPDPTTWKPSWDEAPTWAGMLALCGHGNWYWLSHEGKHHELRGKSLVVNGPHAWSAIATVGRLGFYCTGDEAKTMWEPRHNAMYPAKPAE